ncbi:hypothetical protein DFS33DRAFT_368917 [Desarmillaria ectypa]|nr:hypothetical protein DFS33DRAFT_368917 [Desarmillaria ectypa]
MPSRFYIICIVWFHVVRSIYRSLSFCNHSLAINLTTGATHNCIFIKAGVSYRPLLCSSLTEGHIRKQATRSALLHMAHQVQYDIEVLFLFEIVNARTHVYCTVCVADAGVGTPLNYSVTSEGTGY